MISTGDDFLNCKKAFLLIACTEHQFFPDQWNKFSHPYKKLEYGKWELHIPQNGDGSCPLHHLSEVKVISELVNNL